MQRSCEFVVVDSAECAARRVLAAVDGRLLRGHQREREIAWRCADRLRLRGFLGYGLDRMPADHSTLSWTRRLIDLETHREGFGWILEMLGRRRWLKGRMVATAAAQAAR